MNTAYSSWHEGTGDGPRWDAVPTDPANLTAAAQEHAVPHRNAVQGFEYGLGRDNPGFAAKMRERYAPMYYEMHRLDLASDPAGAEHHVATQKLAEALVEQKPINLPAAQNLLSEYGTREQIAREYMLWKHSLLPQHVGEWPEDSGADLAGLTGLSPRRHDENDLEALDQGLNEAYGGHTRSTRLARVGFANAASFSPLRGITHYPSGNMILGKIPGNDERSYFNNRKTGVEEMAHSMLQRHYKAVMPDFNKWVTSQAAGDTDKHQHLSRHAHGMQLPERGDYTEELAHAMAHGAFDKPSMETTSPDAPTGEAVAYAGRLFRQDPVRRPATFRSFAQ